MKRCVLLGTLLSPAVDAGCPAPPLVATRIDVVECRFHEARADPEFGKAVSAHVDAWDDLSEGERAHRIERIHDDNTGAIVLARISGHADDEELFLRSADPVVCDRFPVARTVPVTIQPTCPMIPFQAPTRWLITETVCGSNPSDLCGGSDG